GSIGQLRIGSFPTASERLLPHALSLFQGRYPGVDLHLEEGEQHELIPMLKAKELDVILMYRYGLEHSTFPQEYHIKKLLIENLILLMPSTDPLVSDQSPSVEIGHLADRTWIAPRPETA